jgi:hypothetical protein
VDTGLNALAVLLFFLVEVRKEAVIKFWFNFTTDIILATTNSKILFLLLILVRAGKVKELTPQISIYKLDIYSYL